MGLGIAHAFSLACPNVVMVDVSTAQLDKAVKAIHDIIDGGVKLGKVSAETIRSRIVDAVPPAHHVHAGDTHRARRAEPDELSQPAICKQPRGLRGFC